jgi:hypothetical protein
MGELDPEGVLESVLEIASGGGIQLRVDDDSPTVSFYVEVDLLTPEQRESDTPTRCAGSSMWLFLTPDEAHILGDQLLKFAEFAKRGGQDERQAD